MIAKALKKDQPVVLRNVGTLETYQKAPQRYRHPVTGQVRVAGAKRHIRFILSPRMRTSLRRKGA
jgi:nucleoid DNA-binding protein